MLDLVDPAHPIAMVYIVNIREPTFAPWYMEGGICLLFQYDCDPAKDGRMTFPKMRLVNYDSITDHQSWEPACIQSLRMEPSLDDPWAEMEVVKLLGAGYSVNSNRVAGVTPLAQFEGDEADSLISYLFSGRWDRSTLVTGRSQRYGQF